MDGPFDDDDDDRGASGGCWARLLLNQYSPRSSDLFPLSSSFFTYAWRVSASLPSSLSLSLSSGVSAERFLTDHL